MENQTISAPTEQMNHQVLERTLAKDVRKPVIIPPISIPGDWQQKTGRALTMIESFYHAFHGIWVGLKEERNVRIHFLAAIAVIAGGLYFNIDTTSWIALSFAIGLVLTTEFLNTSLEHLVNLSAGGEWHHSARYAKDTAAAAVLCASTVSLIVGLFVFLPRIAPMIFSH